MFSKTRYILFSAITLFVLVFSLATPITTYADEGTPPVDVPATEPGAAPDNTSSEAPASEPAADNSTDQSSAEPGAASDNTSSEAPASEPAADNSADQSSAESGTAPDNTSSEAPASEPAADNSADQSSAESGTAPDSTSSEAPATEPAADNSTDQSPTEPVTVPEILAQVPAETQVVVINQDGKVEPLATNNAADILVSGDPYFFDGTKNVGYSASGSCPGVVNPLDCHTASNPIQAAVNAYRDTPSATGSIIVEAATYNENVSINASLGSLANLTGLIGAGSGTTILNGSITVTKLSNPFTLSGFTVQNATVTAENVPGNGVSISGNANIGVSDVIVTNAAGAGAYLDTCVAVGGVCTGTGNINVTDSQFNNNASSGVVVNPAGNVTFTSVTANGNRDYGADVVDHTPGGNVQVIGGTFSGNDDKGISVISNGTITLNNVNVSSNLRDGAYLKSLNGINITGSHFDQNPWTGLYIETSGSVFLEHVSADQNGVTGAYIDARSGTGGITVQNGSTFFSNGDLGLKGMTGKGAITLSGVTINGDSDTSRGAWLKTFDGGTVRIENSVFQNALGNGLEVISSGNVDLVNTTASDNGENGAQVYSTHSYACFGPRGIVVTTNAGTYQNNAGYGIWVSPGPEGSFVRLNSPAFGSNLLGDFLLDLEDHCQGCDDPGTSPKPTPTPEKKPVNKVTVPETGGDPVTQDCENTSGTLLQFENGTSVNVGCPFSGASQIESVGKDKLPHELPVGPDFVSAVSVGLTSNGQPVENITEGGKVTISFKIPADMKNGHFSILYWDPTANNGAGDWVELPLAQFGGAEFPLNPDDPNDPRTIFSGVQVSGDTVTVTVNFPGVFALVSR